MLHCSSTIGPKMRILHLTDLHYTSNQPFQRALIEALLKDIEQQVRDGFLANFIVFSGDLVHDPDEEKVYEAFEANFLRPLLGAAKLTEKNVIFCPGNHDVSRRAIQDWPIQRDQLKAAMAGDQDDLAKLLKTGP